MKVKKSSHINLHLYEVILDSVGVHCHADWFNIVNSKVKFKSCASFFIYIETVIAWDRIIGICSKFGIIQGSSLNVYFYVTQMICKNFQFFRKRIFRPILGRITLLHFLIACREEEKKMDTKHEGWSLLDIFFLVYLIGDLWSFSGEKISSRHSVITRATIHYLSVQKRIRHFFFLLILPSRFFFSHLIFLRWWLRLIIYAYIRTIRVPCLYLFFFSP